MSLEAERCQQMPTTTRATGSVDQVGLMSMMVSDGYGRYMGLHCISDLLLLHLQTDDGESGLLSTMLEYQSSMPVDHMDRLFLTAVKLWRRHVGGLSSQQRTFNSAQEAHEVLIDWIEQHLA